MTARRFLTATCSVALTMAAVARAEPPADGSPTTDLLLSRAGAGDAMRLMRSAIPDDRLRGVERAAHLHTPEGLALLRRAAGTDGSTSLDPRWPPEGVARSDPRALLAVVRGLAAWTSDETARSALAAIVAAPGEALATHVPALATSDPTSDEADGGARVRLARSEAAIALASSGSELGFEALVALARAGGPGKEAALAALSIDPPQGPVPLGGIVLTTPELIALAAEIGDLRSLDAILHAAGANDPVLRAAAISALGALGDMRAVDAARTAAGDSDPRVRIAAAGALVRFGSPDAAHAVATLIADDATALDGLRLARDAAGDEIAKAAEDRVSPEPTLRATTGAALIALGRQSTGSAVAALARFATDPALSADAVGALAQSPVPAAMTALESLASSTGNDAGAMRRLAARGYFVRRYVRGDRSAHLDAVVAGLAVSGDGRDRAVAIEALVALGERSLASGLADPDARVRRAAALGALAQDGARRTPALVERLAVERDDATRVSLALGFTDAGVEESPSTAPTSTLLRRARAGGPDAPLATLALARRNEARLRDTVDALLGSRDAILRAHAARGLGESAAPDAAGRLERAYAWEGDDGVRRAIVGALAARASTCPDACLRTLDLAARLDPDRIVRQAARVGLAGHAPPRYAIPRDVFWLRLLPAEGAAMPPHPAATLILGDGLAIPIAFDDEGYAVVPGVPPGDGRVRLAPSDQPYSAATP